MGACASTCRAWREDAENDEEVRGVPLQQERAQQAPQDHVHHWLHHHNPDPLPPMALPGGAPSTYVPLAIIGGPATFVPSPDSKAAAAAAAAAGVQNGGGGGGGGVHRSPSEVQLFFRASQELSMAHLVRHPRLQPFHRGEGGAAPWLPMQTRRPCAAVAAEAPGATNSQRALEPGCEALQSLPMP